MTGERVAVVTGAAQGIGRRVAEVLSAEGYALAVMDRQPVAADLAVLGDVSTEADVIAFAAAVDERFGRVDVVVNNAGIAFITPLEETTLDDWRRVIDVNLTGPFLLCREFGRLMLGAGAGAIVNIASVAGLRGVADRAAYNASKHGLIGLTRTLAAEWGGRGVRVNAVCPGWVKTEMDEASQAEGAYGDSDITDHVPQARFATPDDIAQAVAFLADPARSGFVNGEALSVDGGWFADGSWQALRLSARARLVH
ncbi:SDR family NAD(P)-dependent oxidoreductase [Phytohabitans suffuscus]|uniref:D-threitol dehydrogenase n=1 Tax=Phytohabitans suffuscus TaxID=624315 RepID=A0A6F8YP42_9ACTN|nr:SDR family oxidoreductase [Phytohabitans suffuscus]BCB87892.1 D-threitol dehydrogenase [Phytohabitans suffuscus]